MSRRRLDRFKATLGISSMVLMDLPQFRVLRDYADPGATRRMHQHADATYHVFVLLTGQLSLTVEGEQPQDVKPGQALSAQGRRNAHVQEHGHRHRHDRRSVRESTEVDTAIGRPQLARVNWWPRFGRTSQVLIGG